MSTLRKTRMNSSLITVLLASMATQASPDFSQAKRCQLYDDLPGNEAIEWGFLKYQPKVRHINLGKFAELACCAKNYDSLTWTFNGKDYPFGLNGDSAHYVELRKDQGNQTLLLREVFLNMEGNYTCSVRKGNMKRSRSISLYVYPTRGHSGPAIFSEPPHDTYAAVGENVTFVCEGFFGTKKQIFWAAQVIWRVVYPYESELSKFKRYSTRHWYSENRLYLKRLLTIYNVQPEDFGRRFNCLVSNGMSSVGGYDNKTVRLMEKPIIKVQDQQYRDVLIGVAAVALAVILATILVWNFRLEIRIYLRDKFSKSELTDEIRFGAFFVYAEGSEWDSSFVTGELLEVVEEQMGYNVLISDRDFIPGNAIAEEHVRCMNASARFVAVLTPAFLKDPWCDFSLNVALEAKKNIVFLYMQEIENWDEFSNRDLMQSAVSVMPVIKWPQKETSRNKDKFYKRLRLKLPPQPKSDINRKEAATGTRSKTTNCDITKDSTNNTNISKVNAITIGFSSEVKKKDDFITMY